jgi:predicted DCC family thiol-disulfide oxidoreductase YuxK
MTMDTFDDAGTRLLVIFDGRCGFCNRSVRWLLRRDGDDRLRFVPFESSKVTELLTRHGFSDPITRSNPNTVLVVRDAGGSTESVLFGSDAWLALLAEFPRPWPAISTALRWIPRPLRDFGYRFVARMRYRIGGRLESCPVPTPAERARFL